MKVLYRRHAIIRHKVDPATVAACLPSNYSATTLREGYANQYTVIAGEDRAGWTLEGYVIPRLASALIFAEIMP